MKAINTTFWVIAVLIGLQCLLFLYRGVSIIGEYTGVLRWMWIFKIVTYLGIVIMGFLVFRIKKSLNLSGFFDSQNVKQLRSFGFLGLGVAIFNSLANAGMSTWHYYKKEVSFEQAQGKFLFYFAEHVFDHSLIVYVLVLSILLLTYFTQKAIEVKSENEAFI
ncbi:hypothetical protein [Spirosoma lituiforme]